MTSNQIEMAKLNETRRANLSREKEDRRHNVTNEAITREGNASKISSPYGLISLAGERTVYGTDANPGNLDRYVQTGEYPTNGSYSTAQHLGNPITIYQDMKGSSKFKTAVNNFRRKVGNKVKSFVKNSKTLGGKS